MSSNSDERTKVNMTMSQSARRKQLDKMIAEHETDKKQIIKMVSVCISISSISLCSADSCFTKNASLA